jgi:sulfofructose kinase
MSDRPRIIGIGIATLDYLAVAKTAAPGGTTRLEDLAVDGGGLAATAMVAAARLGAQAELWTRTGDDFVGDVVVRQLVDEGLPADTLIRVPGGRTPASVILVDPDTGDRTIYFHPGSGLEVDVSGLPYERVRQAGCLLVDDFWEAASLPAARVAREAGVPVVADMVPSDHNGALLALVDVLIAPEAAARRVDCAYDLAEAVRRLRDLGPAAVVITAGPRGAWFNDGEQVRHQPAFPVKAVDTTGAGDVFHGSFAFGLASGWEVARCVEFAAAVAALGCTKLGGRAGIPTRAQADAFLAGRR